MAARKRIVVTLPLPLLREMDRLAGREQGARNRLIMEAMSLYIAMQKRHMRGSLEAGYKEMGAINLALAEEGIPVDNEAQALSGGWPGAD